MSQPLLTILGALLVQPSFREAMKANTKDALKNYGFVLNRREHEILAKIMNSLRTGQLDGAIEVFSRSGGGDPCPVWPCEALAIVKPDDAGSYYSAV